MKKKLHDPSVEKHEIAGHLVAIRKKPREELRIDNERKKFLVTDDGYNLADAAYDKPYPSLLDAVTAFLERKRKYEGK
jgi:hypothetical protein